MRTQEKKMHSLGIRSVYLSEEDLSLHDIEKGHYDILLSSPETILGKYRNTVAALAKENLLGAIFIDEAHCIRKFGQKSTATNRPAFRPFYGKLGELRSLAGPDTPVIALTATASIETQAIIKKTLCLTDCLDVIISPNKPNMKYTVHFCDSDDVRLNFSWLIQLLNEKGIETPRMIIFFRKVEHMSTVYKHVVYELRNSSESKQQLDENIKLIDMFHMKTTDSVKESICESYHDQFGSLRVVLCTTSFSMGLDVKGVNSVVHYGLANDLEDYIQETGRAGRNPNDKCHAILMKYKRCTSSKNISADMKKYVTSITCRRKQILKPFITGLDTDSVSSTISHDCCDICTKSCKCLCNCDDVCGCTVLCSVKLSTISEYMEKAKQTHNSSSSSSEGDSTSIDFLTDSDFEGYISKKPQVMSSDDLSE